MGIQASPAATAERATPRRWKTATGEPCPRAVRLDGGLEGSGDCMGCGMCLLFGDLLTR